jgi:hypothetical protein
MLTVVVAVVAAVVFYLEWAAGSGALKWVVVGLAALMIYGLWLYPEAKHHDDEGPETRS